LPINKPEGKVIGWLIPITEKLADNDEIVDSLVKWRQKYLHFFLTQFKPSRERTRNWLKNTVIIDDSRILFLVLDEDRQLTGNYGVCNICRDTAELDNTIRGEKRGDRRLMFYSELCLMNWLYNEVGVNEIYVQVCSSNTKAIEHHRSVGFSITAHYELIEKVVDGEKTYQVGPMIEHIDAERGLVRMDINRESFFRDYPWLRS
jgi:hypothetical protein